MGRPISLNPRWLLHARDIYSTGLLPRLLVLTGKRQVLNEQIEGFNVATRQRVDCILTCRVAVRYLSNDAHEVIVLF